MARVRITFMVLGIFTIKHATQTHTHRHIPTQNNARTRTRATSHHVTRFQILTYKHISTEHSRTHKCIPGVVSEYMHVSVDVTPTAVCLTCGGEGLLLPLRECVYAGGAVVYANASNCWVGKEIIIAAYTRAS